MRAVFTPRERKVILFLSVLFLAGNAIRLYRRHLTAVEGGVLDLGGLEQADSVEVARLLERSIELRRSKESASSASFPLDVNRAAQLELAALPGIGPVLAGRIVKEREERGGFHSLTELLEVPGIGRKTLERLEGFLLPLGPVPARSSRTESAAAPPPGRDRGRADGGSEGGRGPLDPNRATAAELEALPGIGGVLADRIVAYREAHGPFRTLDDLKGVKGIGDERLEQLSPFLSFTP